ncbi:hypothetical protein CLOSBL3_11199 [Clostridiaceae bacterium BL-3]|nr:hypothetical protein CLOSBL3_11199 [Clostridiaceae bacterium BL-3]
MILRRSLEDQMDFCPKAKPLKHQEESNSFGCFYYYLGVDFITGIERFHADFLKISTLQC